MHQAHNPFSTGAVKTVRTKSGCRTRLNPEDLEISNDPIPVKRQLSSQYDAVFEQMKVGQCIKVEPERVGTVSAAMRNWIRRTKRKNVTVKSVSTYLECKEKLGRIWLVPTAKVNDA